MVHQANSNGWLLFKKEKQVESANFFEKYGKQIGLTAGYSYKLIKDKTDIQGKRHQRFQLYWHDVLIEGAEYGLHSKKGILEVANGRVPLDLSLNVTEYMPEIRALDYALKNQKLTLNDFKVGEKIPEGQLMLTSVNGEADATSYRLVYTFLMDMSRTVGDAWVYVDAINGEIVKTLPLATNCGDPSHTDHKRATQPSTPQPDHAPVDNNAFQVGSFVPRYSRYLNGNPSIPFDFDQTGSEYILTAGNPNKPRALETRIDANANGHSFGRGPAGWDDPELKNSTIDWGTSLQDATTAHWVTWKAYQYFRNRYSMLGIDGQGTVGRVLVGTVEANAFWYRGNVNLMTLGSSPTTSRSLATVDITAHEYGHGVTERLMFNSSRNSGWTQAIGEPGSLDEGFSDIIGKIIENYLLPTTTDWTIGEDSWNLRNMARPDLSDTPQPSVYQGQFWNFSPGVRHQNNSVLNKWFHSICTGIGPNNVAINPMTFDNAADIVYWTLDNYLLGGAPTYADVVDATAQSAVDLYGGCSAQERTVRAAWAAGGIATFPCTPGCDYAPPTVTGNLTGMCGDNITLTIPCNGNSVACQQDGIFAVQSANYQFLGQTSIVNPQPVTFRLPTTPGNFRVLINPVPNANCGDGAYKVYDINVSCGNGGVCNPPSDACYTINVDQTGKRLQAMGDNSVQQQTISNASNQIWKIDSRGNGQISFTSQDGTNRVIQANSNPANGVGISLGNYTGTYQHWDLECNPSAMNQWRVYSLANNNTWDLQGYASAPYLQVYGSTSESFATHRSFRFEATNCPTTQPGGCNFAVSPSVSDGNTNRSCGQAVTLNANCSGSDCGGVAYSWSGNGISGSGSSVNFNMPSTNGSYTYSITASKNGCNAQTGPISVNVSGCGGNDPCAAYVVGAQPAYRSPATGDPSVKVVVSDAGGCKRAVWSDGTGAVNRDWLPYLTANSGFSISEMSGCLKFSDEPCGARTATFQNTDNESGLGLVVAPNPNHGQFTVKFRTIAGQASTLRLTDLSGRTVRAAQTVIGTGRLHEEEIRLSGGVHGVLLLEVRSGQQRATQKILVE